MATRIRGPMGYVRMPLGEERPLTGSGLEPRKGWAFNRTLGGFE